MESAEHYRTKAAEMDRLAQAATPEWAVHWTWMSDQWTALGMRTEREDRFVRRFWPEG